MVEPRIVVPAVAGSSPVGHPIAVRVLPGGPRPLTRSEDAAQVIAANSEEGKGWPDTPAVYLAPLLNSSPCAKSSVRVVKAPEEWENAPLEHFGTCFLLLRIRKSLKTWPELRQKTERRLYE